MTLPQFPISGLEQWRVHIQNSITSDAVKNGYTKLNILDSFNFEKLSLESNEMCQHSVMYTSCDIRELAMQCSDENNEYIVMILKLIFHKFLELLKISNDLPDFLSSSNSSKSKEWIRCRTVHVNCHSLPLSTPGDWLNCDDIEHMTHNNADPLYFHDMFYICIPIRLKHSCTHEDQSRESINIVAQKEMAILLTKQFADLYNQIINMKLKEDEYLPLNIDNWAKYYPANSLRVGLFTTLKVSTLHLYRLNPTIFTSPLFIHPLKLNNCSSCSYAWLRKKKFKTDTLLKIKKQKLNENITSTNNNLNTVEAHILALETKNLVFLNGPEVNRNNIIIHRAIRTRINGISTNNQQPQYVGEIGWPGKTANETIDSKYLIGFSNLDSVVVGVLEADKKSSSPNIDNTSTIENWNQGGEIALKFKGKDLEIVGMMIDDYIIQEKYIDNSDDDTTEGPTILIRLCSKYSVIPYFGLRSLLRFHDSLVYNSSALGIASNNQSKQMNISVHLLCCICKFLTIREFAMFRSICRSHCNRIIFNSYIHEIALEEKDLYLPILGQLYPYLSKAKSVRVLQSQTSSFDNMQLIPPIVIQCLAAYTPRAKKMIFSNHSPANLAKIVSRACGRKPEMIVLTKNVNIVNEDGEEEDEERLNRINLIDNVTQEERISRTDQEESTGNSDLVDRNDNINNENIENNVTNNSGNLFDNNEGENNLYNPNTHGTQSEVVSQQLSMPTVPQPSPATTPNIQPHIAELSLPNLIEIHIIGIIESISIIPTSIFRIPATAPFRKLVRYFRDVVSIHEGIVDFYIVRYGIKDRLIPDLTPIDYGILRGPAVLHAIGYKTLQYSQKIWISLFLVGSRNFPYLAKLRFNASMSTPFSRLADSYSRNVNIAVSDVIFYYKDVEIDLSLSPFDYNVRENDTIEVSLRGRSGCQ
ncbi:hypothetical protein cand_035090 [Cryptosporidium andersoni]|uniref:Rad60/SUMO-like domain-containing protein n=1 Tax=Cryptosporidium andersoni TaxID=117008 RepID=A0A1J4MYW6_9CRYT|nr:hypothetical protein cand_035090 [Cryptosporidium andersoni]